LLTVRDLRKFRKSSRSVNQKFGDFPRYRTDLQYTDI